MKVISGGQTGADRGALEAALRLGSDYGGWIPKGRRAEDGRVPDCFDKLQEHSSSDYPPRTWRNVHDSDATLIVARTPLSGGSKLTVRYCREQDRPLLVVSAETLLQRPGADSVADVHRWLACLAERGQPVRVLNVAGSRESSVPGIQQAVRHLVFSLLVMTYNTTPERREDDCDEGGARTEAP